MMLEKSSRFCNFEDDPAHWSELVRCRKLRPPIPCRPKPCGHQRILFPAGSLKGCPRGRQRLLAAGGRGGWLWGYGRHQGALSFGWPGPATSLTSTVIPDRTLAKNESWLSDRWHGWILPGSNQRHTAHPPSFPRDPLNHTLGNRRSRFFVIFLKAERVAELQTDRIGGNSLKKWKGNRVRQACKIGS